MRMKRIRWGIYYVVIVIGLIARIVTAEETMVWKVGLRSIGRIQYGMTIPEAEKTLGVTLKPIDQQPDPACFFVQPEHGPEGISFLVIHDRIKRVDIHAHGIPTLSGIQVGDTENAVIKRYAGKIVIEPHPYEAENNGHYLIFVPKEKQDEAYRLIFETSRGKVTSFRAGVLPEVEWIEGCE